MGKKNQDLEFCESFLPVVPLNTIHNQYNLRPLKYNKYYPMQRDL